MTTYKQPVKERSRVLIWNHAVETLTAKRDDKRILNTTYMEHLWLYCQQWLEEKLDIATFVKWKEFADICYGQKRSEELKVAFFCGNEPENDVKHLLNLGVRIENIYAFEQDKKMFKEAVESLHNTYPLLKIYRGKIEDYADLQNTKFDIVYLDFTGTLFKAYKTVAKLLDMNALTDMSVLIVNTCYPDPTDDNINFLANFFYHDTFFEMSVIDGVEKERIDGDTWFYRAEGCDCYGLDENGIRDIVSENFDYAYSAFQTAFLLDYANRHKPSFEVFKQKMLSDRLVKSDSLSDIDTFTKKYHNVILQESMEDGLRLPSNQYKNDVFIEVKEKGTRLSRIEAMRVAEVFLQSPYRHSYTDYSELREWIKNNPDTTEGMPEGNECEMDLKEILADEVRELINKLNQWFHGKYRFCDMPMEHLWLELLLFQYGHPYHTNVGNHKRYSYKAKERKMCLDIVTLDKCRALYDWMPMLEYFIHDMKNHNRQMITRMCMDAIDKQLLHIVDEVYYGAALVGMNEHEWSKNKVLPNRTEIVVEGLRKNYSITKIVNRILNFLHKFFAIKLLKMKNLLGIKTAKKG